MAYWLFKSESFVWSWQQQIERGEEGEPWTGIRNHTAKKNMQMMRKGDLGLFYHSNKGCEIAGIVEVIKEYESDPTDETGKFGMVTIKAVKTLKKSVTLHQIKQVPELKDMVLVRSSRLSVQPVQESEWNIILQLSE